MLAGEPPDGSDDLKRIEIRSSCFNGKGSAGSLKIDLIALKKQILLLVELKPDFDSADVSKLNEILTTRKQDFANSLLERCNIDMRNLKYIVKCLGLNKLKKEQLPNDFLCLQVCDNLGINILAGTKINKEVLDCLKKNFTF